MQKSTFPADNSFGVSFRGIKKLSTEILGASFANSLSNIGKSLYSELSPIDILKVTSEVLGSKAVSYTHLTLPTICSV